ncbi:MAG: 30S ribosomal protein S7, partial [Nevskia sp.]
MSRRRSPERRIILPDPKFKSELLTKFMNMVMEDGKKSVAEKILYGALDQIAAKKKTDAPLAVLEAAFDNVRPSVE